MLRGNIYGAVVKRAPDIHMLLQDLLAKMRFTDLAKEGMILPGCG